MKILLLFAISFLYLNAQTAEDELTKLRNKFNSVHNFSAQFVQKANSFGNQNKIKGKFFYSKGNKFRVEFENQIICSNGSIIWNYKSFDKRVVINNLSDQPAIFSIDQYVSGFSENCKVEKINSGIRLRDCDDQSALYSSVDIQYNKGYTITSIDVKDNMNNRFAFDLIDVKENSLKDDSIFQFKIPEGCRIIDLR